MVTPVTETVAVVAVVAFAITVTVMTYLLVLARLGKPLALEFRGYGIDLKVGARTLSRSRNDNKESTDDR